MSLRTAFFFLPGLVAGITVHECAHAWSASLLGDGFSRRQGRVSLNPLGHLSPLGTLAMFVLPFGWGRPVQVNLYNFRHPRRDYLLTSLAGPFANILLIVLCVALMQITRRSFAWGHALVPVMTTAHVVLLAGVIANTILAALNLFPLPPLDGSKIWPCLFKRIKPAGGSSTRWVTWLVLVLLLSSRVLNPFLDAVITAVNKRLPTPDAKVFAERIYAAAREMDGGDAVRMEAAASEAIALNPESAEGYGLRAAARTRLQRWQDAAADIRRALELAPNNPDYAQLQKAILQVMASGGWATPTWLPPHPVEAPQSAPE